VTSVARSGWHRAKSSITDEVVSRTTEALATALKDHAEREAEMLRQMSDVFRELSRLSVDVGAVWRAVGDAKAQLVDVEKKVDDLHRKLEAQAVAVAELTDTLGVQIDVETQSTELLGRLLQSARTRLEVVEKAVQAPA
jgi:ABC-type transporter Mla subunit MlaD